MTSGPKAHSWEHCLLSPAHLTMEIRLSGAAQLGPGHSYYRVRTEELTGQAYRGLIVHLSASWKSHSFSPKETEPTFNPGPHLSPPS